MNTQSKTLKQGGNVRNEKNPEPGVGLALSGGGFRATLFHLGTLWRLNELGWLPKLTRITSVSGGSIAAGVLGHRWKRLTFDPQGVATNFETLITEPLRSFCQRNIDVSSGRRCRCTMCVEMSNKLCWEVVCSCPKNFSGLQTM